MSTRKQRKQLAEFRKFVKTREAKKKGIRLKYKSFASAGFPTRPIPVAEHPEVSRSPYLAGAAFEPKNRVEMFPVATQDEGELAEQPSE